MVRFGVPCDIDFNGMQEEQGNDNDNSTVHGCLELERSLLRNLITSLLENSFFVTASI